MNYLIPFIILITIVVFIHEYGHYYFAKKYGVGITDFSIGFGKEIFGWKDKSGTRWKFCWIPLGGYVKFFGDRNVFSQSEQQNIINQYSEEDRNKLFILKPLYQRSLIVAAGPLANFVLAILIFTLINIFVGKDMTPAIIAEVQKNSPAFESGLKKNDKILSIDNKKIESILEVSTFINTSTSESIEFVVMRNGERISFFLSPNVVDGKDTFGNSVKKRMVGIRLSPPNGQFEKKPLGPSKALYYSIKEVWFVTITSLKYLGNMIAGSADSSQLGGPIRIAKITGQVAEYGLVPFFSIMAYISISLGLINLFPIPMLDGGHLMFYFFEKILGKPLSQKTQEGFFRIGLFLLFSLMFFVTFNDLKDLGLF
ncbi:RIP metalloprotease RseP [Pelagibacteraceae bacterium]|nr:RIP metalloprotease RseP [Pelagibacteraceae bacterium]